MMANADPKHVPKLVLCLCAFLWPIFKTLLRPKMKYIFVALSILLLGVSPIAAQELSDIRNFLRVNKEFCTGGQPKLEHLEKLKGEGVKAIINLRQPSEHRAEEEAAKAKELGL